MDEEMEEGPVEVYEVVEVDFDYEFDAARFFDFTRPETEAEAGQSEAWFEFAPSYPPSPFVAKLFPTEDLYSEIVDASPKSKYYSGLSLADCNNDIAQETECCNQPKVYPGSFVAAEERSHLQITGNLAVGLLGDSSRGLFYNHLTDDKGKTKSKLSAKPSLPRSSTLMKPTASQLAKQNQRRQVNGSRFQKNEGNSGAHFGSESQASKRQKLDGGLLRKIVDVRQPINLIHKAPKKDCAVQGVISQAKLRITIPREPELETAHRAERIRSTGIKKAENPTATTSRFRARPLNKKILEAPVVPIPKKNPPHLPVLQAFHLKTIERAKHHATTAVSTSLCQSDKGFDKTSHNRVVETGNKDDKRCDAADAAKRASCQPVHSFKARPLDRKILTSRGDLGVFRNSKREVTIPKEFQFQTTKRNQPNPPIELFSKLSLAGEPYPRSCAQLELSQTSIPSKPSKENRWEEYCHQNQHMNRQAKEKPETCGMQTQSVVNGGIGEIGPRISLRPSGI